MTIKEALSSNIQRHWNFRKGTILEQTGSGGSEVFNGNPYFNNEGLCFNGDDSGDYIDSGATLDYDTNDFSVSCLVKINQFSDFDTIVDNRDSAGTNVGVEVRAQVTATKTIELFIDWGAVNSTVELGALDEGTWYHCVFTVDRSGNAIGYLNGVKITTTDISAQVAVDITNADNVLLGGGATQSVDGGISEIISWDIVLSEAQVAQLYTEALKEATLNHIPEKTNLPETAESTNANCVLDFNMGQDINVEDLTGGDTVSIEGGMDFVPGLFGKATSFESSGARAIQIASGGEVDNIFSGGGSAEAWINPLSDGGSNIGRLFDKTNWLLYTSNEASGMCKLTFIQRFENGGNVDGQWVTTNEVIKLNAWNHIIVNYDRDAAANNPTFIINGTSLTVGSGITEAATPDQDATADTADGLRIGNRSALDRSFDGMIDTVRLYSTTLTGAESTALYEEGKNKLNYYADGKDWNVSTGNVTAGWLENSNWWVRAGSVQVDDSNDGEESKQITAIAATRISVDSTQAYGQWEWDFYKDADSATLLMFMSGDRGEPTTANADQDGYAVQFTVGEGISFFAITNGVAGWSLFTVASATVPVDTWFTCKMTRDNTGSFSFYVNDVLVTAATGANPIADTTHHVSKYFNVVLNADNAMRNFRFSPVIA